jgi:predicted enzyme related to lactoylglutathione lyase
MAFGGLNAPLLAWTTTRASSERIQEFKMMEMSNPVAWFEIPVTDLSRALRFYRTVFGFTFEEMQIGSGRRARLPLRPDGRGASGSLTMDEAYVPSTAGTLVYISVEDVDLTLALIVYAGGKTLLPRVNLGHDGVMAHFEDTEGNRIGLYSTDS